MKISFLPTFTSAFLSKRAFDTKPQATRLARCGNCGYSFFERGLLEEEAARYYRGYRDEAYARGRRGYEPFYTRSAHNAVEQYLSNPNRGAMLKNLLADVQAGEIRDALDYGGGTGQLVGSLGLPAAFVYDISGSPPVDGVKNISNAPGGNSWDLVICAQVLEHVNDPAELTETLFGLLRAGGLLYLEVPDELEWRDRSGPQKAVKASTFLARSSLLFSVVLDCYSTYFRIARKFLPPLGAVPMREHLNYFTLPALKELVSLLPRSDVRAAGKNVDEQLYCIIQKKSN